MQPSNRPVSVAIPTATIDTAELRVGMFVHLDLTWMAHPFALSSFRIASARQIETIRSLGLAKVRWSPEQSDSAVTAPPSSPAPLAASAAAAPIARESAAAPAPTTEQRARAERRDLLTTQRAAVELCQRQYIEASRGWRQATDQALQDPQGAGRGMGALSQALVDKMLGTRETCIRVLAETGSDRASHALNVGVISLLLGKLCGLVETDLQDLGVGALSHDIGKIALPHRVHRAGDSFTPAEHALYREHVARGVDLGRRMGLTPGALLVIAQHHEHCDGSGFPMALGINRLSVASRLVALVNRYDNLCHPSLPSLAVTPHEALSLLFAQSKNLFDATLLTSFVRMMGVYPPGSVVQLTDDRFALVDSVNSSRPLKPRVLVHDMRVPRDEALLLNLDQQPTLGIRRSLPSEQLPPEALDYLRPPQRASWFFDEASDEPPERSGPRH